ncbi:plasmid replication protein RepC [Agrobacterium fabrum]|uniref:plasmid replication protein RepC n=1 Tax=Agrobacterium fabrum TaxID=1176649 RepID=UPI002157489C|nr:plasmid replication protein RepC [Agrobacterium fabrum]MCR6727827.1 plasmid replication protein RepC [Agrobacterium fabrum]
MEPNNVTTPFGRRGISMALVRRQRSSAENKVGKTAEKWKVFRDVSAAKDVLGIQSNSLAVLDALLSFYPENELRCDAQLIVFPSNLQLSLRAHGMPNSTLRRHIAVLVDAGLIVRKDSANGKRYARKDSAGLIESAFGFDLSPLLARSDELAHLGQEVVAERAALRKARENLTICRRDVRKLITAAITEGADGDWHGLEAAYTTLVSRIPRNPTATSLRDILLDMNQLKEEVVNRLEFHEESENISINDAHNEQHIQNSYSESTIELETGLGKEPEEMPKGINHLKIGLKAFPLALVLRACPQIADYGAGGTIGNWRDLMSAAVVVRSMLGVTPSAYQQACEVMGPENAAVAMACILQRISTINSAGGYLRDLARRASVGEFSLGPMIFALLKANARDGLMAA